MTGSGIWMHLTTGRGPAECELALERILKILLVEAAGLKDGLSVDLLETEQTSHGLMSALVALDGAGAGAFSARWSGTLQWNCASPLRPGWSRKRWFVGVSLLTQPEPGSLFSPDDVRLEACRASGPGGQDVNKSSTAIRATHLPAGLSTRAEEERSQQRNRALALARLADKLTASEAASKADIRRTLRSRHDALERGRAVRVFTGLELRSS